MIPPCASFRWVDPNHYKEVGGLSAEQIRTVEESGQHGGTFLTDRCTDQLCGLKLVTSSGPETMLPLGDGNITSVEQLPSSCKEIIASGSVASSSDCGRFCASIVGDAPHAAFAQLCGWASPELAPIFAVCGQVSVHDALAGPLWTPWLAGLSFFVLLLMAALAQAWSAESEAAVSWALVAVGDDTVRLDPTPDPQPVTAADFRPDLCLASGLLLEPPLTLILVFSLLRRGQIVFALCSALPALAVLDPGLRGLRSLASAGLGASSQTFLLHAATEGKVRGTSNALAALTSLLACGHCPAAWLSALVSLGLTLPGASRAELLLRSHDSGLLAWCLSVLTAVTALAWASAWLSGWPGRALGHLLVLAAVAVPRPDDSPAALPQWFRSGGWLQASGIAFLAPCAAIWWARGVTAQAPTPSLWLAISLVSMLLPLMGIVVAPAVRRMGLPEQLLPGLALTHRLACGP